jgi:hypothetical protein
LKRKIIVSLFSFLIISLPASFSRAADQFLEAIIPFVMGSADGLYETRIILFNRYGSDAPVFVATFKNGGSGRIMAANRPIAGKELIPAGGRLVITSGDIKDFLAFQGIDWLPAAGIPVKLNIQVPSLIGSITFSGSFAEESSTAAISGDPRDPYVEGIVTIIFPGGGQENIPLKFKTFKQGLYGR